MRIIAGTKRGMKLVGPESLVTRPITDRVKQSLFDVLQSYGLLADARVADLFCGVGSLGLEALSRGAAFATFAEKDGEVLEFLDKNIAKAGFADKSRVVRAGAFRVGAPTGGQDRYDLVFVDPPYASTQEVGSGSSLADLMRVLEDQVADGGVVVVRTQRSVAVLEEYGRFRAVDRRQWGTMAVVLFRAASNGQPAGGD